MDKDILFNTQENLDYQFVIKGYDRAGNFRSRISSRDIDQLQEEWYKIDRLDSYVISLIVNDEVVWTHKAHDYNSLFEKAYIGEDILAECVSDTAVSRQESMYDALAKEALYE